MKSKLGFVMVMVWLAFADAHADQVLHDKNGDTWTRQVVTELRPHQRTLLLVSDIPSHFGQLPHVVIRRSFAPSEAAQLADAIKKASAAPLVETPLTVTPNPLWPITHPWTVADEDDYTKWINTIADPNFLVGGGVNVDCADYAITLRWIYSHDHGLPAGDQIASGMVLVGSWASTTAWDALPTNSDWKQDQRFKAALAYILTNTYTHTVLYDLYPLTINRTFVRPGSIYLTLDGDSGHTRTIYDVGFDTGNSCSTSDPCISIIWGNEPASELGYESDLVPWYLTEGTGGFLRWRWPVQTASGWQLADPTTMPGYSLEQFTWGAANYLTNAAAGMNLWNTPDERYNLSGQNAADALADRVDTAMMGYYMCSLVPCAPGDALYDQWSTPVRDQDLRSLIATFQTAAAAEPANSQAIADLQQSLAVPVFGGSPYTFFDVLNGQQDQTFSADPTADILARWGITNPAPDVVLQVLASTMANNWYDREMLVAQAEQLCFSNSSAPTTVTCDPNSAAVQALATDRLDQAFRVALVNFTNLYKAASSTVQTELQGILQQYETNESYCASGQCTLYDYVIDDPSPWQKMSSNPTDSDQKRYGF